MLTTQCVLFRSGAAARGAAAAIRRASTEPAKAAVAAAPPVNFGRVRATNIAHKDAIDSMLRVDQAGEVAAVEIYRGQLWMLRGTAAYDKILKMKAGEEVHVATCNRLIAERRARPTLLLPVWQAAGFALGAVTAWLGTPAAMACTVAVETAIGDHYNDQLRQLLTIGGGQLRPQDTGLAAVIKQHRDEELEHLDTGLKSGAEDAPAYAVASQVIKAGCGAAIELAKRV